jgi:hypothetical protein
MKEAHKRSKPCRPICLIGPYDLPFASVVERNTPRPSENRESPPLLIEGNLYFLQQMEATTEVDSIEYGRGAVHFSSGLHLFYSQM